MRERNDLSGKEMADFGVPVSPTVRLNEWFSASIAMPHDSCVTEVICAWRTPLNFDDTNPLIGVLFADLRPRQGAGNRRRGLFR